MAQPVFGAVLGLHGTKMKAKHIYNATIQYFSTRYNIYIYIYMCVCVCVCVCVCYVTSG
jgi:hypothetical protein